MLLYCPPYRDVITGPTSARHTDGKWHWSRYSWAISPGSRSTFKTTYRYSNHTRIHVWHTHSHSNTRLIHTGYENPQLRSITTYARDRLFSACDPEVVRITLKLALENDVWVVYCLMYSSEMCKDVVLMKVWVFKCTFEPMTAERDMNLWREILTANISPEEAELKERLSLNTDAAVLYF